MKTITAGSLSIARISPRRWDYDQLATILRIAISKSGFDVTEAIPGNAGGLDRGVAAS